MGRGVGCMATGIGVVTAEKGCSVGVAVATSSTDEVCVSMTLAGLGVGSAGGVDLHAVGKRMRINITRRIFFDFIFHLHGLYRVIIGK